MENINQRGEQGLWTIYDSKDNVAMKLFFLNDKHNKQFLNIFEHAKLFQKYSLFQNKTINYYVISFKTNGHLKNDEFHYQIF